MLICVYGIACSVSTVGCSQSVPSIQTPEFEAMLNQRLQDQTTYLNEKYERLTTVYEELCQMAMEIRSHMGDPCVPPYWLHGPRDDQPPPHVSPLF
jgi:hypothetical protein